MVLHVDESRSKCLRALPAHWTRVTICNLLYNSTYECRHLLVAVSFSSVSSFVSFYLIISSSSQKHVHSHTPVHVHTYWSDNSQSNSTPLLSLSLILSSASHPPPHPFLQSLPLPLCLLFIHVWLIEGYIQPFLRHSALLCPQSLSIHLSYLPPPDGSPPASNSQQKLQLPFMSNKGKLTLQQMHSAPTHPHTYTHMYEDK